MTRGLVLILFFIGIRTSAAEAMGPSNCIPLLQNNVLADAVIVTVKDLLDERVVNSSSVRALQELKNPFGQRRDQVAQVYRPILDLVIEKLIIDNGLRSRLDQLLIEREEGSANRNVVVNETKQIFVRLHFIDIAPGEFWMGNGQVETLDEPHQRVVITKAFKIASTFVTQWQYEKVMGVGAKAVSYIDTPLNFAVDHIPWNKAKLFIERLNALSDLDSPVVYEIDPSHIAKKHYRLPTEAEWEFVARGRGAWQGNYPDQINDTNIHNYFWRDVGTGSPVGELLPVLIDGNKPIFDLIGNIWTWTEDAYYFKSKSEKVLVDPVAEATQPRHDRVIRGFPTRVSYRHCQDPDSESPRVGIRLVSEP